MSAPAIAWPRLADLRFSQDELDARATYLGASDLYDLRSGKWRRLWLQKTGRQQPEDLSDVLRVQLGLWNEEFIRQWAEEQLDIEIDRSCLGRQFEDPDRPWRRARCDGQVHLPDGRTAAVEIKYTSTSPEDALHNYRAQLHHEMACIGTDCAFLIAVHNTAEQGWKRLRVNTHWSVAQVELDPDYLAAVTRASEEFWRHVEQDAEPADRKGPLF